MCIWFRKNVATFFSEKVSRLHRFLRSTPEALALHKAYHRLFGRLELGMPHIAHPPGVAMCALLNMALQSWTQTVCLRIIEQDMRNDMSRIDLTMMDLYFFACRYSQTLAPSSNALQAS